ncbi:MAG: hypothetical protein ACXVBU_11245 [Ktedonobacteraceae bacterium]
MAAPGQYRYYGKITLTALVIGCVTGDLLFIIPTMIVIGSNGTTTNSPSLADSLLSSIAGLGVLILVVEMVFVMVRDWRGAMTLRFAANTKFWYRGKLVSAKYWFFVLYVVFPYIMLPIYLFRTVMDQRHIAGHKPLESKRHIAQLDAQKGYHPPTRGSCRVCHQPLQVGAAFCANCGEKIGRWE